MVEQSSEIASQIKQDDSQERLIVYHVESKYDQFQPWILADSRKFKCVDYGLFAVTKLSKKLSLLPYQTTDFSKFMLSEFKNPKHIIDATTHIGCSAAHLMYLFPETNFTLFDIDHVAFKLMCSNINRARRWIQQNINKKHKFTKVCAILGDSISMLKQFGHKTSVDCIFIDPPWGELDLKLNNINVERHVEELLVDYQCVVLKTPPAYQLKFTVNLKTTTANIMSVGRTPRVMYQLTAIRPAK